jgi:two-component system response regulator YesN
MYRVLIVDDEPEIRHGLRLKVNWERLQLIIVGEASNGSEALDKLANEGIDILIADMNMPIMNGVSLLEACHELYPSLKLMVVTGYEEFHYAKAAIKNQARDYLLKPVSSDDLTAALSKVTRELDKERSLQDQQEAVQWRLSQYYKEMKEHFIVHLIKGELGHLKDVQERSKLFDLYMWEEMQIRFITIGLRERSFRAEANDRMPEQLRLPFEMLCREFVEKYPEQLHIFRDANYPGLIHCIIRDDETLISVFSHALHTCIIDYLAFEPVISAGQPVFGFNAWKEGYISSLLAWSLSESGNTSKSKNYSDGKAVLSEDSIKIIQRYLIRGELESFEQVIHEELNHAFFESQAHFIKLIFQIYLLLDSMAYAAEVILDGEEQLWVRPERVLGLETVDKASDFLVRLGRKVHFKSKKEADDLELSMTRTAQKFIGENYMYDLDLTTLAERYNYSPTYFSELFKAKVGKTFIQYLTEVRMAHVVRLLQETALNLWDIAELTGFNNVSYFSAKFKRMYGMSPSDFRQRSSEKIDNEMPKK